MFAVNIYNNLKIEILICNMIQRFQTPNGVFHVLKTDTAFVRIFSVGLAWEYDLIKKVLGHVPESGTILDIGGHIGTHAIPYALNRPRAKVISFEPQRRIRELLESNKVANNASSLEIKSFGIGHTESFVHLAADFTSDGYSKDITVNYDGHHSVNFGGLGITNDPRGEKVEIRTVDSLGLTDVIYMKIDVEGAETLAIFGAQNTIKLCHPVLLIEQSDKNLTNYYIDSCPALKDFCVSTFLSSLGYKKQDLGDANYLYTL